MVLARKNTTAALQKKKKNVQNCVINEKYLQVPMIIERPLAVRSATLINFYERGYKFLVQWSQNMLRTKRNIFLSSPSASSCSQGGTRYSLTHVAHNLAASPNSCI
jgi:hypothetical protein